MTTATVDDVVVRRLADSDYATVRDAMIAFTAARDARSVDEIWLVEHAPVYTFGQAGRPEHLREATDIPVVRTERGGQITYHGPGQAVAYLLVDLKRRGLKVRAFVSLIEDAVIETLAAYNRVASTRPGAPGVYVERDGELQKIAALGLKIAGGRSFHGVSLNVAMDLSPYDAIDACGYPGLRTVDLRSLGVDAAVEAVGARLADALIVGLARASREAGR